MTAAEIYEKIKARFDDAVSELDEKNLTQLPDKRWQITWEKKNPRLHEHYILKWEW